ncbi:MAG: diacylglycerol kinase family protein [Patescibacteria group bacterium]|nr:diacylglycerol kinase family protein [Patescibacteria group bacterium]
MDYKRFKNSFAYAMRGIGEIWRREQNFRVEVIVGIIVIVAAYYFHLRLIEKAILILVIMLVLGSEGVNTVLESLIDGTSRAMNAYFRLAKDIMAGIVLVAAIGAVLIGFVIFYPYLVANLG